MEHGFSLHPLKAQLISTIRELELCNDMTEQYGLTLTRAQIQRLAEHRFLALRNTDRIEFGEGILKKLIYSFCDSPYLTQEYYEQTMIDLQDIFYYFKNESMEKLSDDELIDLMKFVFDGKAQGSLDYLAGTSLEILCRSLRGGQTFEKEEDQDFDEIDEVDYE